MSAFPRSETEIIALAQLVTVGLTQNATDFPNPPVNPADLQAMLGQYGTALAVTTQSDMSSQQGHATKDQILAQIQDGVKAILKYAEVTARKSPGKLVGLGWGPRRNKSPLVAPGEVRDIAIASEGDTWLVLRWNPPVDGGITAFYQIQRKQAAGGWEDAGTSTTTERVVSNQPRGVELSYRVIAVNKAGAGNPSGVVTAVL